MKSESTQKETNAQDETAPLLLPENENVDTPSSDIKDHDADQKNNADLDDESGEDKEAYVDNANDQDKTTKKDDQTSKEHETHQEKETVKDHETEKNQDDIKLSGCKKSCQDIHSIENNVKDTSDVSVLDSRQNFTKKEQNQTENIEMLPQRKDVVLPIDEVCKSYQNVGLTIENLVQEGAKQSLGDDLIAMEDNVVIEMDTDVDGNVSTHKKFKSFS